MTPFRDVLVRLRERESIACVQTPPFPRNRLSLQFFLRGGGRLHTGYCSINAVLASLKSFNVLVSRFIESLTINSHSLFSNCP